MNSRSLVSEWFEIGGTELRTAKYLFDTMYPKPLEIICYLCQQSAEKALKGFLHFHEIQPPFTHSLDMLCPMCAEIDPAFQQFQNSCARLTNYATSTRYPSPVDITEPDASFALRDAESVYAFCVDLIPELQLTQEQDDERSQEQEPKPTM